MSDNASALERVFVQERGRILATLIRLLGGDFDRAEDALASALAEVEGRSRLLIQLIRAT